MAQASSVGRGTGRFAQPLRFAALTLAQNSLVWVLRICSDFDTGCNGVCRRAAVAQWATSSGGYCAWLTADS
jgi:hypothetical protein